MKEYKVRLPAETAAFYERAAKQAGKPRSRYCPTRFLNLRVSWRWKPCIKKDEPLENVRFYPLTNGKNVIS